MIRLALLIGLGALGCSSVYWILYLTLPAVVALFILQKGGNQYLEEASPRIVLALRWLAAAYAYLWLLTDEVPGSESLAVLEIETGGSPTAASALARLIFSLPALGLLIVLSFAAGILWLIAALAILAWERVPVAITDFMTLTLRFQFRLLAYHLSLIERYPSFDASGTLASGTSPARA